MHKQFQQRVLEMTGARSLSKIEDIQSLWSGYGAISRYALSGGRVDQVVVKHVKLPEQSEHPRGWNTHRSHQRKVRSYEVESAWYRDYGERCDEHCRVPHCLGLETHKDEFLMVLEDLNINGFPVRKDSVSLAEMQPCLSWLAYFHATFMNCSPAGLWETGTYWHLATRPDELEALADAPLKAAASTIDQRLQDAPYQTLIHGDAKLANFCFSNDGHRVAAVDFQYVGGGCGMKDLAYFIGSCLGESDCQRYEKQLLDIYFERLKTALIQRQVVLEPEAVEQAWRPLYRLAWTDFHRFIKGWSPGHWKIHCYSEGLAREVLSDLNSPEQAD